MSLRLFTIEQKIASGYNRLLQTTHEGGAQDKEYRAKYAADRVRNFSGISMRGSLRGGRRRRSCRETCCS